MSIVLILLFTDCVCTYIAAGEPPQAMSNAVLFAVKRAIESARHDMNNTDIISLCEHNPMHL